MSSLPVTRLANEATLGGAGRHQERREDNVLRGEARIGFQEANLAPGFSGKAKIR